MGIEGLRPSAWFLLFGLLLDAGFGDPRYALHPIRLIGRTLSAYEGRLRRWGLFGYSGGCLFFLLLAVTWVAAPCLLILSLYRWNPYVAAVVHVFLVFSLMALRDLLDHVQTVE